MFRAIPCVIACLVLFGAVHAREPVASSAHFVFFNDFEFNLHDAILAAGVERKFGREELFQSGDAKECFEALAPSEQSGWDLAVEYYERVISEHEFNDRQQFVLRLGIAGIGVPDEREREFIDIAAGFRAAAAPAYEKCRWDDQQAANQQWIAEMSALLDHHEAVVASRMATAYMKPWPDGQMQIDIVGTVSWAGAKLVLPAGPTRGHLLISSEYEGAEAFETIFHEASHGFMLRGHPLKDALSDAAAELGVDEPRGLWHVVQFVTTGEIVREIVAESGYPDYVPMIYEIYTRSSWGNYKDAMDEVWPSYLDGSVTAQQATLELIEKVKENE